MVWCRGRYRPTALPPFPPTYISIIFAAMADAFLQVADSLSGSYEVLRELGAGGMATVYLAHDPKHDRKVAVKVLRPEVAAAVGAERFLAEIKVTANLQHPHILPLFDSGKAVRRYGGTAEGGPAEILYYVMPFVEGESLREKMDREGQLAVDEALEIVSKVASALDYAHRRNVIHRDIKPENILLHDGQPVVADFGIALATSDDAGKRITATGMALGTPEYMSPEQATAERVVDARSDVYALGCLLYEMLAGEPPHTGHNAQSVLAKMLVDPIPSVRRLRHTVPVPVDAAISHALAKQAEDRIPSASGFVEAFSSPGEAPLSNRNSIAVLPLLSMSTDPENEFFADGITEDVTAQLSKISALKVISRSSTMRYKNHEESLKEIGATLGVGTVLEGSVRRAGNRVRIVVQLIDSETDAHIWTETYDRELTDIFAIQSDVALQIAAALEAELTDDQRSRIEKEPTKDLSAYHLYLRGRQSVSLFTPVGLRDGIVYLEQAAEKDPAFAHAYAHMAVAYVAIGMGYGGGDLQPNEAYAKAKEVAAKALAIDPDLADAHAAIAFPTFVHDFEWEEAERSFKRALELNPNAADTLDFYGLLLAAQRRFDEAVTVQRKAQELDPLTEWHTTDLASTLMRAGRCDEALREMEALLEREPESRLGHMTGGWVYMKSGDREKGIAMLEKARAHSGDDTAALGQLGEAYAMAGREQDARAVLRELEEVGQRKYVPPYHKAYVYTGLGEHDRALDALEQSFDERAGAIYGIKGSFLLEPLQGHPRFRSLLRKLNLEERR